MIIDTQAHLWQSDRPDRPWPPYRHLGSHHPEAGPPVGAGEMLAAMDEVGVDRLIIVPPTWTGEGNESALKWTAQHPDRFRVMGRFDLWDPEAPRRLERWLDQPGMVGIRNSWTESFGTRWLDPDAFAWFWSGVERLGIPLMMLPPGGASALGPIAERYPGITLIIDHLGLRPTRALHREESSDDGPFARFDEVLDLARFPQVMVKFSDLPNLSDEPFPYPAMTPYLKRAFDAFGPRRIMWGSDYTMLTAGGHTYRECLDHVRSLAFLTEEDREWILGKTAASALNWPT